MATKSDIQKKRTKSDLMDTQNNKMSAFDCKKTFSCRVFGKIGSVFGFELSDHLVK